MTFTYDLASVDEDELLISKVRLELGDTTSGEGVKPSGGNFSDEELAIWLEEESNHVMHTVIRACLTLGRMWTNVANLTVGPRREELGKVAEGWLKNATSLTDQYGAPTGAGSAFAVASDRVDGYSEHADESSLA
jgi:hypothetical protein